MEHLVWSAVFLVFLTFCFLVLKVLYTQSTHTLLWITKYFSNGSAHYRASLNCKEAIFLYVWHEISFFSQFLLIMYTVCLVLFCPITARYLIIQMICRKKKNPLKSKVSPLIYRKMTVFTSKSAFQWTVILLRTVCKMKTSPNSHQALKMNSYMDIFGHN